MKPGFRSPGHDDCSAGGGNPGLHSAAEWALDRILSRELDLFDSRHESCGPRNIERNGKEV